MCAPSARNKKVYLKTFGCQMNVLDSQILLDKLVVEGYEQVDSEDEADLILYNTCSVRNRAEQKVLSRLGALKKQKLNNPALKVGVLGCMAQRMGESLLKKYPVVDMVAGTHQMISLPEYMAQTPNDDKIAVLEQETERELDLTRPITTRLSGFQAYVSVMRGCDRACAYCVVPSVRGREQHRPIEAIVEECQRLAESGVKEITLLGQNINAYGKHLYGRRALGEALEALCEIEGLLRIRFVTSHPSDIKDELLQAMRLPKVCPYLHMPAQSGSNRILKLMQRGYTCEKYLDVIEQARKTVPDIEIAGDMIVGFPTETEEDFEASISLLKASAYQNAFIFKYSPRPGTPAAQRDDDIPKEVKQQRNHILLDIQKEISQHQHRAMHGQTVEVLTEGTSKKDPQKLTGRTPQNHIVCFEGPESLNGKLVRVQVMDSTPLTLFGNQQEPAARNA